MPERLSIWLYHLSHDKSMKLFYVSFFHCAETFLLTHSFLMHPFYIAWKQKNFLQMFKMQPYTTLIFVLFVYFVINKQSTTLNTSQTTFFSVSIYRNIRPKVFLEKLKKLFAKFTEKHLWWCTILVKLLC